MGCLFTVAPLCVRCSSDMIVHRFDFSDEEIVTYYVNFCKSLSFKLNSRTILFFFNEISQDFPLLNETIKFFNHADSMIRIAVRTITLNIFRINDLALRRYILNKSAVPYFSHLVWFLRDETVKFDKLMHSPQATVGRLETGMEHLLDQIYYLQDVLSSGAGLDEMQGGGFKERDHAEEDAAEHAHIYGIEADPSSKVVLASTGKAGGLYFQHLISEILLDQLLGFYVLPLLCGSLVPALSKVPAHSLIAPRLSFFLLTQLLGVFTHTDFVNSVLSVLVCSRLSPLALRLIQEPPRGPVRNSDGTPLTTLLYPQSRETRRANVNPELILLHQGPLESRSSKRIAHTNHSNLHTPKPQRDASLPQSTSFSRGDGSGANTPQPPTTDSPATEPRTVKPQAMADMELQPIAPKQSPNAEAAAAASTAASSEPSSNSSALASTTMSPDTRSPSTSVSTSVVQSSAEPTISADQSAATTDASPASSSALSISTSADSSAAPKSILSPPPAGGWECRCTFVNKPTFLVCSVCGSIRPRSPEWDQAEAAVAAADAAAATGGLVPVVAALPVAVAPSTPAQLASVSVVSTPITNASLASAYLTPGGTTLPSTPASSAGIGAGVRSPVASVPSSSATPSGTPLSREIPVDENSRARSKLPEVGPLYSPIDYFGFVKMSATAAAGEALMAASSPMDSSPVAAAVNAVAAAASASPAVSASPPVSASPAAALSSTTLFPVVAVQGTRVDNRRLVEEAESNEYATALLRYLAAAQAECAPAPAVVTLQELEPSTPLSPLHVPSSPVMLPSDRSAASAPDERDIYGSMSVLYSALRHEQADATLLLSANLAAQSHRKSRQLLQSLLADRVGGGGSQTDLLGLLGSPLDSMATPVVKPSRAQRQAAAANGADDKIAEDGRLASGAIPSSLWDSPNDARAGAAGSASSDLLRFDVHMSEVQSGATGSPPPVGAAKSPSPASLLDFSEAAAASSGASPDGVLPVAAHQRRASSNAPAHEQMEEHDSLEAQPESPANASASSVTASPQPQVPAAHAMPGRTESVGSSDPLLQRAAHTRVLSVTMPSPTKTGGAPKSSVNHKGSPSRPLFADSGDSDLSDLSLVTPQRPLAAPSNARTVSISGVPEYNEDLVSQLLNLATHHPPYRMVTLQTMIELVNQFVVTAEPPAVQQGAAHPSYLLPAHVAQLDALYLRLVSEVRSKLTQPLWNLFLLDMFEEEYPAWTSAGPGWDSAGTMAVKKILANVQNLMPIEEKYNAAVSMDYRVQSNATGAINAALNAAASSVPLVSATGAPIPAAAAPTPAVPSAEIERLRKGVQLLLLVRNLRLKNAVQRDTLFYPAPPGPSASPSPSPPPNNTSCAVQPLQSQLFHVSRLSLRQEILTAHHPDAMLCTICEVGAKKKLHLFFVMDEWETMLVELQQNKPGTAIVQLRNSLRHQEVRATSATSCSSIAERRMRSHCLLVCFVFVRLSSTATTRVCFT